MAITLEGFDTPAGNPTVSFTLTTTAGVALDDLIIVEFTHRGTGIGTVTDNSGDGIPWTHKGSALYSASAFSVQQYYKRATAAMVGGGDTITVSGLTNSCAGYSVRYRGVIASGDPFEAWVADQNKAAGAETHAGVTTLTANAWVGMVNGTSPDTTITYTSPLIERVEHLSTGGTDTACAHASYAKVSTGATGTLTFNWLTNQVSAAIAYALKPEPSATNLTAENGTLTFGGGSATAFAVSLSKGKLFFPVHPYPVAPRPPLVFFSAGRAVAAGAVTLSAENGLVTFGGGTATVSTAPLAAVTVGRVMTPFRRLQPVLRKRRPLIKRTRITAAPAGPTNLDASGGVLTFAGGTATVTTAYTAAGGVLTFGGGTATVTVGLTAAGGVVTFAGGTAIAGTGLILSAIGGVVTFGGGVATTARVVSATGGAVTFGGGSASLTYTRSATGGVVTFGGGQVALTVRLSATGGAVSFAGGSATIEIGTALSASGGVITFGGGTATAGVGLLATGGAITFVGGTATAVSFIPTLGVVDASSAILVGVDGNSSLVGVD